MTNEFQKRVWSLSRPSVIAARIKNRLEALSRLKILIESAGFVAKSRRPTKPTRGSQLRRMDKKAQHGKKEKHACKTKFGLKFMIESGNHPFDTLTPDLLIDAVESQGFLSDGGFLALNSYENRVYQIGIENKTPMIAKFYRPNRWTDEQIFEEHQFCFQLQEQELPVVCPWLNSEGKEY